MSDASDAAAAAGVDIEFAPSVDDLVTFFDTIWGRGGDFATYRAIAHAGNSVLLVRRDGEVVGGALGVLGWAGGLHVHSHMVAVAPDIRASGIGFAIKLAQREQALEHGVTEMRWTYDPLIRRNAHFNLVKLGASVIAFHPNFYGTLDDAINGTDATDRFEVSWRLDAPVGRAPATGPVDFALPADYEAMRRDDPEQAATLRRSSTRAFAVLPTGLAPGGYVFGT
jgi:predicted GNAT superfamily acetyltransferase